MTKRVSLDPQLVELAVITAAAVLTLALAVRVVTDFLQRRHATGLTVAYAQATGSTPAATTQAASQRDEQVRRIGERNVMAPPRPPGFLGQFTGVLGDAAIFNGAQLGKVGQNVMGAKVLTIGPNWVEIEFEGQKQKLYVFAPMPPGRPMMPPGARPMRGMPPGATPAPGDPATPRLPDATRLPASRPAHPG